MRAAPTFDDIFAVMAAASVGDLTARVTLPEHPQVSDQATTFALALNILIDDLALRAAEARRELGERQRMADRLRVLSETAHEFSSATGGDYDALVEIVARRMGELIGDLSIIRSISDDGQWLEAVGAAVFHRDPALLQVARDGLLADRQRVGEGVSGRVAASGQALLMASVKTSDFVAASQPKYAAALEHLGVTSAITLPLSCRGKVVGVANLMRGGSAAPYDENDLSFAKSLADHAAVAIGNARLYAAERASHAAAGQTRALLASIVESSRDAIVSKRLDGTITSWNRAAEGLFGYASEDIVGRPITVIIPDDRLNEERALVARVAAGERVELYETVRLRKDGTKVPVSISLSPILDAAGQVVGVSKTARDLTSQRQAVAALRRTEDQLRQAQKMEAVGRLAGGVAHDFNNVLSVILSYADLLHADMRPNDPMREEVDEIGQAAKRAAGLTRQLLMFSRQQVIEPKVLDLNDVLINMDKMLQRILGADVDLESRPARSLGRVLVDPGNIEQVIMNLVVNARDAMPTGGKLTMETGNVELGEEYAREHLGVKAGPHVMLAVTDTGTGMDKATVARIFEPFFTTKEAGKGTGLGLSTVFGIVQQSGGSVWVYSEPGQGTTFKIYLPRVDTAVDVSRPVVMPATLRGSETILLVEDDDQVRTVARGILGRSGYHVIEARNAGEALLHSEKYAGRIHLLLSDVVMPQMSGPELAQRLASVRPDMKVLCMSGYTDDSIVRHGVLEARIAFLQKPITPESLTLKVREVLEGPSRSPPRD